MLEDPPKAHDRLHVEVVSTSSRMGLLHPKVQIATTVKNALTLKHANVQLIYNIDVCLHTTFQKLKSCWFDIYLVTVCLMN